MNAFITGSHAYGTPTKESDIDLVVLLSDKDYDKLTGIVEDTKDASWDGPELGYDSTSLRFGSLNIICLTDNKAYVAWRDGTIQLKKEAPVTRERAIEVLSGLLDKYGVT